MEGKELCRYVFSAGVKLSLIPGVPWNMSYTIIALPAFVVSLISLSLVVVSPEVSVCTLPGRSFVQPLATNTPSSWEMDTPEVDLSEAPIAFTTTGHTGGCISFIDELNANKTIIPMSQKPQGRKR